MSSEACISDQIYLREGIRAHVMRTHADWKIRFVVVANLNIPASSCRCLSLKFILVLVVGSYTFLSYALNQN
jgi:hypothetical protein